MKLTQEDLVTIVSILRQVQLPYKDSVKINLIIDKLDSYIIKAKPEEITNVPLEGKVVSS